MVDTDDSVYKLKNNDSERLCPVLGSVLFSSTWLFRGNYPRSRSKLCHFCRRFTTVLGLQGMHNYSVVIIIEACERDLKLDAREYASSERRLNRGPLVHSRTQEIMRLGPADRCSDRGRRSQARNLGVVFDSSDSLHEHLTSVLALHRTLYGVKENSGTSSTIRQQKLVHVSITSRLDYCNSLLFGSPNQI